MPEEEQGIKAEQFKEIFDMFVNKVPGLLNGLTDAMYGKAASAKFSAALADFYRTLKTSGMTDEQAFKLTEQYMSSLNLAGAVASALGKRRGGDR